MNIEIKPQLIALMTAYFKIGRIGWSKLSDVDTTRISDSSTLILHAVLQLAGMPSDTLRGVMVAYGISDSDIGI